MMASMRVSLVTSVLIATLLASWAQGPVIIDQRFEGDEFVVEHEAREDSYYILNEVKLETDDEAGRDIKLGDSADPMLKDEDPPWERGFYRVTEVPIENPIDSDGDGMNDVYELEEMLDPLDPSDASQSVILDGETTTRRNAYLYNYEVGRGRFDVTGVAANGSMMGYAEFSQRSSGIHDRQWARAFIVRDRKPPHRRVVFVVVDNGQVFQSIYQGVFGKIRADDELKPYYSYENIVLSATHTHGGAGGHSHFPLFHLSTGGYSWRTYDALVHGIYMAIKNAHRDLEPGSIRRNRGLLTNANENRRPRAFAQNVEHDYPDILGNPYGSDNRDTEMTLLRFDHQFRGPVAMFNWFPVHGVSVTKLNKLLTGDNKGNAAYLFEKDNGAIYPGYGGYRSDASTFVAGFANSNPGDLTANRRCLESPPFDPWPEPGPDQSAYDEHFDADDDYGRAELIGGRQFDKATSLFEGTDGQLTKVTGPIDYRHLYVDMNAVSVTPTEIYPYDMVGFPGVSELSLWSTCLGSLGVEFAGGTKDGEALPDWVVDLLVGIGGSNSSDCQAPKDVLVTTASPGAGGLAPHWLPISILRVGDFVILAVPAEFTVMAGHRLRKTVELAFAEHGQRVRAVLAGLSNSYSGYVTTYEEYVYEELVVVGSGEGPCSEDVVNDNPQQGYEAASTHFGRFTLAAYQTKFREMALAMAQGTNAPASPDTVSMPSQAIPVPSMPEDTLPVLDVLPAGNAVPATYHEPAGCPSGQFHIVLTEDCWSCPEDYQRALVVTTAADACEQPAFSTFSAATRHLGPGCPAGSVFDPINGGSCWKCPFEYNRDFLFPVNGNKACKKPAVSDVTNATFVLPVSACTAGYTDAHGRCYKCPSGYNKNVLVAWNASNACSKSIFDSRAANSVSRRSPCPSGHTRVRSAIPFWDRCYKCPDGYNKLLLPTWDDPKTCEKITPAQFSEAEELNGGALLCPAGQFLDVPTGRCWSCPEDYNRNILFPIDGDAACEKVTPRKTTAAVKEEKFACELRDPDWFLDIGRNECWSCPEGTIRNANPVDDEEACTKLEIPPVFGDPRKAPKGSYTKGDTVEASFWSGHPKNVFDFGGGTNMVETFFKLQRKIGNAWTTVRTDADWDTQFHWTPSGLSGSATFKWVIPADATNGTYRVVHEGYHSDLIQGLVPYSGVSTEFQVN